MSIQDNSMRDNSMNEELRLKELRHRTTNFLNLLNSTIRLKQEKLKTEEAQIACSELLCVVDAYTQVFHFISGKEKLPCSGSTNGNDSGDGVGDSDSDGAGSGDEFFKAEYLFHPLIANLKNFPNVQEQQISLEADIGSHQLRVQHAIPLALIIIESFTNTLKYAFPVEHTGPRRFFVHLDGKSSSDVSPYSHRLILTDTGVGCAHGTGEVNSGSGSGIAIMKSLAQQIDGQLEVDYSTGAVLQLDF